MPFIDLKRNKNNQNAQNSKQQQAAVAQGGSQQNDSQSQQTDMKQGQTSNVQQPNSTPTQQQGGSTQQNQQSAAVSPNQDPAEETDQVNVYDLGAAKNEQGGSGLSAAFTIDDEQQQNKQASQKVQAPQNQSLQNSNQQQATSQQPQSQQQASLVQQYQRQTQNNQQVKENKGPDFQQQQNNLQQLEEKLANNSKQSIEQSNASNNQVKATVAKDNQQMQRQPQSQQSQVTQNTQLQNGQQQQSQGQQLADTNSANQPYKQLKSEEEQQQMDVLSADDLPPLPSLNKDQQQKQQSDTKAEIAKNNTAVSQTKQQLNGPQSQEVESNKQVQPSQADESNSQDAETIHPNSAYDNASVQPANTGLSGRAQRQDQQGLQKTQSTQEQPATKQVNNVNQQKQQIASNQKQSNQANMSSSMQPQAQKGQENLSVSNLETKEYNLQGLLKQAIKMGASDLHLTAGYKAIVRIGGKLQTIPSPELTGDKIKQLLDEVVAKYDRANLEKSRDIDVAYRLPESNARFRVNIFQQKGTYSAAFRLIPTQIHTLEELRLPTILREFTKFSQGLVLITGPTSSGKSTTLASLLSEINVKEAKHLITIEDPIEYVFPKSKALVDQREVHADTKDWQSGMRSILRQDPDVVMVGEMRDLPTIESTLRVAETGHLVFSTLHTNSASQTVTRIIDAFPKDSQSQVRTQLANTLMAVVSQRLVPVTGGGLRPATEIMVVTSAIRAAIRDSKVYQIDNMIQTGGELGMMSLEKSLVGLVREGVISTEQAQLYANKPDNVANLLDNNLS